MAKVSVKNKTAKGTSFSNPETELFEQRIVFLTGPITDDVAENITMQLLCLNHISVDPITLVVNSPGGSVSAGLSIVDCMDSISSPVHVFGTGVIASMASIILACGEKGHRTLSSNADVLIHQLLTSGMAGQASDIAIAAESMLKKKKRLNCLLAKACNKSEQQIEKATDRDTWMSALEAVSFGIADSIKTTWDKEKQCANQS